MKKTLFTVLLLFTILLGMPFFTFTVQCGGFNPNKLLGAPNYVLNLLGKKDGWSGGGTYDNPDRHTMFVPQTTAPSEGTLADGTPIETNLTMWITQGNEFAVIDGNAFDDGDVDLQLGPGKYAVYVVALGKQGGGANIRGWIYNATDNTYLLLTGMVSVPGHNKRPVWINATDLLFVGAAEDPYDIINGDTWVFDYMTLLASADNVELSNYLYLWDLDINGCMHLQLRFYKIA